MRIGDHSYRTIWLAPDDPYCVCVIDQRALPFEWEIVSLRTLDEAATAIQKMVVRGAPLIGVTAAYGLYLSALSAPDHQWQSALQAAVRQLNATRPTAVDLFHATAAGLAAAVAAPDLPTARASLLAFAQQLAEESVEQCRCIGAHGLPLLRAIYALNGEKPVQVLTHCNAGWLACIDYGTALAPVYAAHRAGLPVHVWVDETRPRLQGARLTAYELQQEGVSHTVITDNAGGHLMQHGQVDVVLVGADRVTRTGDVANKIGTYLKALAAQDNRIPFYVALPATSIDWELRNGLTDIPIETRTGHEVSHLTGWDGERHQTVQLTPVGSPVSNYGFDVTPARLVTGLITERGICAASEAGLLGLYPERTTTATLNDLAH